MKNRVVSCPTCKKKFNFYSSEFKPFCSERCRIIDLGQWLSEAYAVPAQKLSDEELANLEQISDEKKSFEDI